MDKTIEEIRKSVLAYCEEVCPNVGDELEINHEARIKHVLLRGDWHQWEVRCPIFNGDGYTWMPVFKIAPYPSLLDCSMIYRLLGLETRDAVAPYKSENERLQSAWMAEKARNTALVEALEWIKQEHGYRYTYGDGFGNVVEKRINSVGVAVDNALTANTEKGGANE